MMAESSDSQQGISDYFEYVKKAIDLVSRDEVNVVVELLWQNYVEGRRVAFCGNGGSSATASHLPADLQKNIMLKGGRPWECISLCDSVPLITAWSNDSSFSTAIAGQARVWMRPGDILIAISGSGNSSNIIEAVKQAKSNAAITIGISGFDGGLLAEIADYKIVVPVHNMQAVEDVHMAIGHCIFLSLTNKLENS
jgi:D-sedoheptulose 7-phosphate isomerase